MHLQYSYYEKIICKICLTKHTRHGGYVIIYTCRHLLYIKGGRLKRYHRAQSGAACIQFDFAIGAMIGVGSAIRYVVEKIRAIHPARATFSCPAVVYYDKRYIHIDRYFHPGQARRAARRRFGNYKYR